MSRISGSGVSMPDLIILAAELCQIKLKTRRNQWKFARIDVFGRVGFHGFSTSELETDPPASGFGNRDPWPTRGAVGSGERRSGTGGLGGLGGWAGGLDSPTCKIRILIRIFPIRKDPLLQETKVNFTLL